MVQLRPHLAREEFVQRAIRQMSQGYRLLYIEDEGTVLAVAGYRLLENLAWGKFLYVDDLVTDAAHRSAGLGASLLDSLLTIARQNGCAELHLDSGVQRFGAHRFYVGQRMDITSHHFAMKVPAAECAS